MIAVAIFPVFIAVAVVMEVVAGRRCVKRIDQWATVNRFTLVSMKRRWLSTGAWGFWRNARSRRYFDLTVIDAAGATRLGTAEISGGWGGVVADVIDVRWS